MLRKTDSCRIIILNTKGGDCMGSFGSFYKGDKKKKKQSKKGDASTTSSNRPVFVAPKIIEKKKKDW